MRQFALLFVLAICNVACAQTTDRTKINEPTCANPVGIWVNEMGSTLNIMAMDANGYIQGTYSSPSGAGSTAYPLIGWVNNSEVNPTDPCASCKENNKGVISFTVRWGTIGSITSWTGTCATNEDGTLVLKTMWHLSRPNTQFSWDHTLSGADIFTPQ